MGGDARAFKQLFPRDNVPLILSTILQVSGAFHKESETELEDSVTRRLHRLLTKIYPFRDGPLGIHRQPEIDYDDTAGEIRIGKVDLLISCGLGDKVCFVIEAKRLRFRSSSGRFIAGNNDYVNEGMMRFVTGQYAPSMISSAMMGYVFDGKTAAARSGIDKYIQTKTNELNLEKPRRLEQSNILPGEYVDETRHDLGDRSFTIYHVLLGV